MAARSRGWRRRLLSRLVRNGHKARLGPSDRPRMVAMVEQLHAHARRTVDRRFYLPMPAQARAERMARALLAIATFRTVPCPHGGAR